MRQMRRCAARACMSLGLCVLCKTREVGKERSEKCHGRRGERARCGGFRLLAHTVGPKVTKGRRQISRLRRAYRRQLGEQQPQCVAAVASRTDAWARGRASASEVRGGGHSSSLACLLPAHALRHSPRKRSRAVPQATDSRPRRPAAGARGQHGAAQRGASCCGSN